MKTWNLFPNCEHLVAHDGEIKRPHAGPFNHGVPLSEMWSARFGMQHFFRNIFQTNSVITQFLPADSSTKWTLKLSHTCSIRNPITTGSCKSLSTISAPLVHLPVPLFNLSYHIARPLNLAAMSDLCFGVKSQIGNASHLGVTEVLFFTKSYKWKKQRWKKWTIGRLLHETMWFWRSPTVRQFKMADRRIRSQQKLCSE